MLSNELNMGLAIWTGVEKKSLERKNINFLIKKKIRVLQSVEMVILTVS